MSTSGAATPAQSKMFIDEMRRRARRQVLGAVALLFLSLTVLPVLFEKRSSNQAPAPQVRWETSDKESISPDPSLSVPSTPAVQPLVSSADTEESSLPLATSEPDSAPEPVAKAVSKTHTNKASLKAAETTDVADEAPKERKEKKIQKVAAAEESNESQLNSKKKTVKHIQEPVQDSEEMAQKSSDRESIEAIEEKEKLAKAVKLAQAKKKRERELALARQEKIEREKHERQLEEARLLKRKRALEEEAAAIESRVSRYRRIEDEDLDMRPVRATKTKVESLSLEREKIRDTSDANMRNEGTSRSSKKRYSEEDSKPRSTEEQSSSQKSSAYIVQLAALGSEEKAIAIRARLRAMGLGAYTQKTVSRDGEAVYRIRIGPYHQRESAANTVHLLRGRGYNAVLASVRKSPD